MLKQTTKKSKSSERKVTILAGLCKPSGMICAKVRNDQGKEYFPRVHPDGTTHCSCAAYDPEKGNGRYQCYHVGAVIEVSHIFGPEGLLIDEVAANHDRSYAQALGYEQVDNPRLEICRCCGNRDDRCQNGRCFWVPTYEAL